ncbi:MAG: hypothetical protein AAGB04_07920 [Pseudomonadota bacterium]
MVGFLGGLLRVIFGFVLSCLAAGAVQVLFAVTPTELADAGWEYWNQGGVWVLESATIFAVFAAPFAAVSALISEWFGIRSFAYHGFVGIAIAIAGFGLITTGEAEGVPTIVNSYAMAAFLTTGLVAGFTYWLFSGRFAYRPDVDDDDGQDVPRTVTDRSGPSGLASPSDAPKKSTVVAQPGQQAAPSDRAGPTRQASSRDSSRPPIPPIGVAKGPSGQTLDNSAKLPPLPPNIPQKPLEPGKPSSPSPSTGTVPPTRPKPKTFDA